MPQEEDNVMEYITKDDLKGHTKDIKEHISLVIDPVKKDVEILQKTVFGKTGSNGMARTVSILKWASGLIAAGFGILIHKIFIL